MYHSRRTFTGEKGCWEGRCSTGERESRDSESELQKAGLKYKGHDLTGHMDEDFLNARVLEGGCGWSGQSPGAVKRTQWDEHTVDAPERAWTEKRSPER